MDTSNSIGVKKNEHLYIYFINVVSAFAVLTLHTNGCFWNFSATERYWQTANIIESVFYFAVPLFFMISGCTLLDFYDRYSLKDFFVKRVKKTVIPYLAWSLIGIFWLIITRAIDLQSITLGSIYEGIIGNKFIGIFWFFKPLFIMYLCIPLFASVEKNKRKQVFSYLILIGFILNNLIPFMKNILKTEINTPYNVPVVSSILIWPLIGWLLHNVELQKKHKVIIYVLAVCGLLTHICGTYYLSIKAGTIVSTYKGYENVPCILYSVGVYVALKDIGTKIMKNAAVRKTVKYIAQYTFAIYIMQFFLLNICSRYLETKSIIYRLGAPFVMIPIIICVTWCLRRIPIIKHIVP